ncbi:hypothetical protein GCM10009746_06720 [Microbacterium paludicola]
MSSHPGGSAPARVSDTAATAPAAASTAAASEAMTILRVRIPPSCPARPARALSPVGRPPPARSGRTIARVSSQTPPQQAHPTEAADTAAPIALMPLGTQDAAVCIDGVCILPGSTDS